MSGLADGSIEQRREVRVELHLALGGTVVCLRRRRGHDRRHEGASAAIGVADQRRVVRHAVGRDVEVATADRIALARITRSTLVCEEHRFEPAVVEVLVVDHLGDAEVRAGVDCAAARQDRKQERHAEKPRQQRLHRLGS